MNIITKFIAILFCLICVLSCQKDGGNDVNPIDNEIKHELSPFSVSLIERRYKHAVIQWTSSLSSNVNDSVRYKIVLDGQVVDSNLTRTTDSLSGMLYNRPYQGTVIAYTSSGLTKSSAFVLESLEGSLYVSNSYENSLGSYNIFNDGVNNPKIWQNNNLDRHNETTPTISNDTIFFASGSGTDGTIAAYNTVNGSKYWSVKPDYSYLNLTYSQGNLYTATGSGAVSINSRNGKQNWIFEHPSVYTKGYLTSNVVVNNGKIFLGSKASISYMMALNSATGVPVWEYMIDGQMSSTPVIANNLVIFNGGPHVYALDQNTGALVWRTNNVGGWENSPILADSIIIVSAPQLLTALNARTGAIIWSKIYPDTYSLAIGQGVCYLSGTVTVTPGTYKQKFIAVNIHNGEKVWENMTHLPHLTQFIYAHNSLYARDYYNIWRFNALSGIPEGVFTFIWIGKTFSIKINNQVYYNYENGNYK